MSKFTGHESIAAYPVVKFYPRPYYVEFGLDYKVTPLIPHVVMRVAPSAAAEGGGEARSKVYVPFTLRDAKRLRDWLNVYINDREGILR
jgi:hypothetical protein